MDSYGMNCIKCGNILDGSWISNKECYPCFKKNQDKNLLMEIDMTKKKETTTVYKDPNKYDPVEKPAHYNFSEFEPIKVIKAWGLGYNLGNTVKYIARAGKKDPNKLIEDLKKARWYLDDYIKDLEKE